MNNELRIMGWATKYERVRTYEHGLPETTV